jgi:hypothetical protein
MPELPDYVSDEREVSVTVEKPNGETENFNTKYDYIVFIEVRDDGVWIRDEVGTNTFYPSERILEIKMGSSGEKVPEKLQKQRRQ